MNKKYEILNEDVHTILSPIRDKYIEVHPIRALRDIKTPYGTIKAGEIGGYIESDWNLDQDDNSWIDDKSYVTGEVFIGGNSFICDSEIHGSIVPDDDHEFHCDFFGSMIVHSSLNADGYDVSGSRLYHCTSSGNGICRIYKSNLCDCTLIDQPSISRCDFFCKEMCPTSQYEKPRDKHYDYENQLTINYKDIVTFDAIELNQ